MTVMGSRGRSRLALVTAALLAALALVTLQSATRAPARAITDAAGACLSSTSLNFGTRSLASTSPPQTVLLTSCGADPLTVTSIAMTGTNPGDFAIASDTCTGVTLAPTTSCMLTITFTPTAIDGRSANVSITDDAPSSPQQVYLYGTGATARVCLSASSLNFGTLVLGTVSEPETIVVNNCGTDVLTFTSITLTGANPGDFDLTDNCSAAPLEATTGCTLVITFTAAAAGSRSATILIADDAPSAPQQAYLYGTGAAPAFCASSTSFNFGTIRPGTTSPAQTLAVTNCGTDVLTFTSITKTGTNPADFAITDNCSGFPLNPTSSCLITITFTPGGIDGRSASLSILDTAPGSPHSIYLAGSGATPRLCWSAGSFSFGSRAVGTTSPAQTVLITNCGSDPLTITSLSLTGANPGDFGLAPNSCTAAPLAPTESCSANLTFKPTVTGSRTAYLTAVDNAPASPHSTYLYGTGT
jgi:hypothetical protein